MYVGLPIIAFVTIQHAIWYRSLIFVAMAKCFFFNFYKKIIPESGIKERTLSAANDTD